MFGNDKGRPVIHGGKEHLLGLQGMRQKKQSQPAITPAAPTSTMPDRSHAPPIRSPPPSSEYRQPTPSERELCNKWLINGGAPGPPQAQGQTPAPGTTGAGSAADRQPAQSGAGPSSRRLSPSTVPEGNPFRHQFYAGNCILVHLRFNLSHRCWKGRSRLPPTASATPMPGASASKP